MRSYSWQGHEVFGLHCVYKNLRILVLPSWIRMRMVALHWRYMSPLFLNSVSVIIVLWQEFENSLGLSFEASFHAFNKLSLRKSYSFFALRTYIIIIEEEIMVDNCGRRILSHVWKPNMSIGKFTGSNARTEHVSPRCHKSLRVVLLPRQQATISSADIMLLLPTFKPVEFLNLGELINNNNKNSHD